MSGGRRRKGTRNEIESSAHQREPAVASMVEEASSDGPHLGREISWREAETRLDRLALGAAGVTVVLWASAFVAIRGAGREFSPGALALGRLVCGTVVLGLMAWRRRTPLPPRAAWLGIVASGFLWFGVYMVALNWGEQELDAGTAAMVVSLGPVIVALLSGWLLKEGFPRGLMVGLVVSLVGVFVVAIAAASGGHASVAGVLLCVAAALSFAAAVVIQKQAFRHASSVQVITFGAAAGRVGVLTIRRSTHFSGRHRSPIFNPERLLPRRVSNSDRFHHLGVRPGQNPGGKDGRHHLPRAGDNRAHVVGDPWPGAELAGHRGRRPVFRRRRYLEAPPSPT